MSQSWNEMIVAFWDLWQLVLITLFWRFEWQQQWFTVVFSCSGFLNHWFSNLRFSSSIEIFTQVKTFKMDAALALIFLEESVQLTWTWLSLLVLFICVCAAVTAIENFLINVFVRSSLHVLWSCRFDKFSMIVQLPLYGLSMHLLSKFLMILRRHFRQLIYCRLTLKASWIAAKLWKLDQSWFANEFVLCWFVIKFYLILYLLQFWWTVWWITIFRLIVTCSLRQQFKTFPLLAFDLQTSLLYLLNSYFCLRDCLIILVSDRLIL